MGKYFSLLQHKMPPIKLSHVRREMFDVVWLDHLLCVCVRHKTYPLAVWWVPNRWSQTDCWPHTVRWPSELPPCSPPDCWAVQSKGCHSWRLPGFRISDWAAPRLTPADCFVSVLGGHLAVPFLARRQRQIPNLTHHLKKISKELSLSFWAQVKCRRIANIQSQVKY